MPPNTMKKLPILVLPCLALLFALGCGSGDAPKDDSALRSQLDKKEIDPSNVPPAQREMVLAQMRKNGASAKAEELEKQWGLKK